MAVVVTRRARLADVRAGLDPGIGEQMHAMVAELYPICRSITGDGVRSTLRRVAEDVPLTVHEVPSGTPVLDWTVPPEWNIRDAYVANAAGERVIDFRVSNLHVVNYSEPVRTRMTRQELEARVFTLPDRPDLVPYRTAYYDRTWGFCASARQLAAIPDGDYDVVIDSTLEDGSLTYGECVIPGATVDEVLLSCHVCHPSLANDNLSGIVVATTAARLLAGVDLRHTYRLVYVPGTIGSIAWLAANEEAVGRIRHGLVLTGLGDRGIFTYKRSRRGDAAVDRAAEHVLATRPDAGSAVIDFSPWGYDERQYCSPGYDLPVGRLSRTPHGEYPEYHTSGDDLDFVTAESLAGSLATVLDILDVLERDGTYRNTNPRGEPQLGRRGLYGAIGGAFDRKSVEMAMLWVLNLSDGTSSLLDVARRSGLPFDSVCTAAELLARNELLVAAD